MRYKNTYHAWTDPDGGMSASYHHLSYILFRTDSDEAEIVGARCPDMVAFSAGRSLVDALGLDDEAREYLFGAAEYDALLVVLTDVGLGILDKRYSAYAGLGIYWHLHGRPDGLARLIAGGVLGNPDKGVYRVSRRVTEAAGGVAAVAGDMPSYGALSDGWPILTEKAPGEWGRGDFGDGIYAETLWNRMDKMAGFVGCGLIREDLEDGAWPPAERLRCPRPALLEILLLDLLTEARNESATREAVCRVGRIEDTGMPRIELRYPVEDARGETRLAGIHRHLGWVCELSGLKLQSERIPLSRRKRSDGEALSYRKITLEWLHDPAVLSSSDLKARLRLLYEQERE